MHFPNFIMSYGPYILVIQPNFVKRRLSFAFRSNFWSLPADLTTEYKLVRKFSHPAETVRHIWFPPRLSTISCFLPRLLCVINSFMHRPSTWFCFLPRLSAGSRVLAGSHFSLAAVSAGSRITQTVSAEDKYTQQQKKCENLLLLNWLQIKCVKFKKCVLRVKLTVY